MKSHMGNGCCVIQGARSSPAEVRPAAPGAPVPAPGGDPVSKTAIRKVGCLRIFDLTIWRFRIFLNRTTKSHAPIHMLMLVGLGLGLAGIGCAGHFGWLHLLVKTPPDEMSSQVGVDSCVPNCHKSSLNALCL